MQLRATLITLLALLATSLFGQSAYWSPPSGSLQKGKANMLELHLEDCSPNGLPTLPSVPKLQIDLRNRASSQSTFNGRTTFEYILTYAVTPQGDGAVTIPSFEVDTNAGRIRVPEARYEIVAATVGNTGASPDEIFTGQLAARDATIYEGEVFEIQYIAGVKQGYQVVELGDPDWSAPGLVTSGLAQTQEGAFDRNGQRYIGRAYVAEAMATEAGAVELPPVAQSASIVVGRRRGFPFDEPIVDSYAFQSEGASIEVKPLPAGAPASFDGAVGDFSFASRIVPEEVRVGEPITWTLELAGTGNWPAGIGVPSRKVAASFRTIQPDLKNEFADKSLFEATQTEDVVLIPTEAGRFTLGPVEFSFFDPEEERYVTLSVPAQTVAVKPAAAPARPPAPQDRSADAPASGERAPEPDLEPAGENLAKQARALPREPISPDEAAGAARSLPSGRVDTSGIVYALAAPLALWLLLAAVEALRLDPGRPRRKARAALRALAGESPSGAEEIAAYQRRWREAVRRYLGIAADEPSAREIAAAAQAADWGALWQDSDRFLFSANVPAFEEWQTRFAAALEGAPKSRLSLSALLSARSWAPALALAALALAFAPETRAAPAADPRALFQKGEFARAKDAWRDAVQAEPENWAHRYNAGVAASQQGKWGEAWAWWTSAYALEPKDERVVWNLQLAHTKTGAYYPPLVDMIEGRGVYAAARLLPPAGWERFAGYAAIASGALLCLAVVCLYLAPLRGLGGIALALGLAAGVGVFAAQWLHSKYELLAQPQAVLAAAESSLRAAPTDLTPDADAAPLREGSVGLLRGRFLGWAKVELPNGDIGWTRAEALIPLYGAPIPADS